MNQIHVFVGTKAQYIKTAPMLALMDEARIDYRFIDSGQHAGMRDELRSNLGLRVPDYILGGTQSVESVLAGFVWLLRLLLRLRSRRRIRAELFGGAGGVCVVHGDTLSTLLATLLARRAGIPVAHVESGLRSYSLVHPFPEELIRIAVMRRSTILFAPDETARANLERMKGVSGRIVVTSGNTAIDALRSSLPRDAPEPGSGAVLLSIHRFENLYRRSRMRMCVEVAEQIAQSWPVRFLLHGPTRRSLERFGLLARLERSGVEVGSLLGHQDFLAQLRVAPFVVADGGSVQEESALLGVPCLLWRSRTERSDGIGRNVVLSRYDTEVVDAFLRDPESYRSRPSDLRESPSREVLDVLLEELA